MLANISLHKPSLLPHCPSKNAQIALFTKQNKLQHVIQTKPISERLDAFTCNYLKQVSIYSWLSNWRTHRMVSCSCAIKSRSCRVIASASCTVSCSTSSLSLFAPLPSPVSAPPSTSLWATRPGLALFCANMCAANDVCNHSTSSCTSNNNNYTIVLASQISQN